METEAYPVGDAAGHAFPGLRVANRSLFLARGHAYVRFTYGSCWIFNITAEAPGVGAGVLIRAIEPLEGIALMVRNRRRFAGDGFGARSWTLDGGAWDRQAV